LSSPVLLTSARWLTCFPNAHVVGAGPWLCRVRPLVFCVKAWARTNDLNSARDGTLSSYAWVNMVLFYLQVWVCGVWVCGCVCVVCVGVCGWV
jgi:hypothetical protein